MSNPLTKGAIKEIILNPDNLPKNPILQVLGLKKVGQGQSNPNDRYRLVLSDSIHAHTCAMLATQLNNMVNENEIESKAVIRLDKYICNIIQGTRKVLILLAVTVIQKASESDRYGEPVQYDEKTAGNINGSSEQHSKPNFVPSPVKTNRNQQPPTALGNSRFGSNQRNNTVSGNQTCSSGNVYPISSLNPYHNRWTICARVTSKSTIREWSNSRGTGRLFNVDLIDESGEIRATCFTDLVDKFYPILEANKVYYISKGSLKPANKKYSSLKNDYELTFNNDTSIEPCNEFKNLPTLQFNFRDILTIQNVAPDQLVDVIGVCSSISDLAEITTRAGKQVVKRTITLMDKTASIECTLWGTEAESFERYAGKNPILAIKGARVSDFSGRSISILGSSVVQTDPDDMQEAFSLRQWYDRADHSNVVSLTGQRGDISATNVYKNVCDIMGDVQRMSDKPEYFNVVASIVHIKKDNCLYKACPKDSCNKKVIEDGENFICEKCNKTYPNFKHRLLLRVNFSDGSRVFWATCFQSTAEDILGKTANEVGEMMETDEKAFDRLFDERNFRLFFFAMRSKIDKYNDEARLKCTVDKVQPVNFSKETRRVMLDLDQLMQS